MLTISRSWHAALPFVLFSCLSLSAQAQSADSALEKNLEAIPLEKIMGQVLSSIDVDAVTKIASQTAEKAAADVAAGKTPELGNIGESQVAKDMQAKMQQQMSQLAPELIRGFASLIGPMLTEMKKEMASELGR